MSAIRDSAGLSTIGGISVRDSAGLSVIASGSIRDSGGLSAFFSSGGGVSNSLTPDEVDGFGYSKTPIAITTQPATISNVPSGATIVWNFSPSSGWSATSASPTSEFRKTAVAAGDTESTTVSATVTAGGYSYTTNGILATVGNTFG